MCNTRVSGRGSVRLDSDCLSSYLLSGASACVIHVGVEGGSVRLASRCMSRRRGEAKCRGFQCCNFGYLQQLYHNYHDYHHYHEYGMVGGPATIGGDPRSRIRRRPMATLGYAVPTHGGLDNLPWQATPTSPTTFTTTTNYHYYHITTTTTTTTTTDVFLLARHGPEARDLA